MFERRYYLYGTERIGSIQRVGARHRSPSTNAVAVLGWIHPAGDRVLRPGDHRGGRRRERRRRDQHDDSEVVRYHLHRARDHLTRPLTSTLF